MSRMPSSERSRFLGVCLGILLCACASAPQRSGFLGDYSNLAPQAGDQSLLYYEKPGVKWGEYRALMLDPVVIYLHPEAKNRGGDPLRLKELADYFREVVIEELEGEFPIVNKPGKGVLRVRAAITDVILADPLLNAVSTAALMLPVDMGGAAIEAEFLDSLSNERLAAMVDKKLGTPVDLRIYQGFTPEGHAKAAFKEWASELKQALTETE